MKSVELPPLLQDGFWDKILATADSIPDDHLHNLQRIAAEYGQAMEPNVQAALTDLHTSMSWTQVTLLGILAVVYSKDLNRQGALEAAAVAIAWILITNFFVRTSKNYINIIRFNLLRRSSLEFVTGAQVFPDKECDLFKQWAAAVSEYQISWHCPLPRSTVARKVLFEFAFASAFAVVVFLTVRAFRLMPLCDPRMLLLAAGVAAAAAELIHFFGYSPYFSKIRVDPILQKQA